MEQTSGAGYSHKTLTADQIVRVRILSRLEEIDAESTRPLRAVMVGRATDADHEKLQMLDTEANTLRTELSGLLASLSL
ncbi:MAG: hypothetical protein LBM17_05220 [Candidatus Accumulibacter sp.]|jgi:hypothetical protein|nr:hypothetical protein [Accumulibacter sp.]